QKLLPLIQQVYNGWAMAMGNRQVLTDVVELLGRTVPAAVVGNVPLPFNHAISLENISYAYPGSPAPVLRGVNLDIPQGARVGIAGKTGSGKSTLVDLVLGLLEPDAGVIRID